MPSRIVGNKNQFAIEFRQGSLPELGFVKLWFNNVYVGAEEEVYFSYVQGELQYILASKDKLENFPYESNSARSIIDQVVKHKTSSLNRYTMKGFGESFDDFTIICFYSNNDVNFVWQLIDKPYSNYHEHSATAQRFSLDVNDFRLIVDEFNNELRKSL